MDQDGDDPYKGLKEMETLAGALSALGEKGTLLRVLQHSEPSEDLLQGSALGVLAGWVKGGCVGDPPPGCPFLAQPKSHVVLEHVL